jgi:nucleoside-diphosphate-sugar epimerase
MTRARIKISRDWPVLSPDLASLCGRGRGLRQPVHAEDCAVGAISAAQSVRAANRVYDLPGGETITYREMIGRIFDGLKRRRFIVPVPPPLWLLASLWYSVIFRASKPRWAFEWQRT